MERLNCLSYWLPLVQAAGVNVPKTEIVRFDGLSVEMCDENVPKGYYDFLGRLVLAGTGVRFLCFLRTGHTSGKHDWSRTCYVPHAENLPGRVYQLVEWSEMVDIIGLPHDVWVVREFLPLCHYFRAFRDMPVAKERRYFFKDGKVLCHHSYWPEAALEGHVSAMAPQDWRVHLAALNAETDREVKLLTGLTEKVAAQFPAGQAWSLDWCMHTDGRWFCLDAAVMERSYHWPVCPNEPEEMRKDREQEEKRKAERMAEMMRVRKEMGLTGDL